MADRSQGPGTGATNEPDEAALAVVARHALHDEELIAAYATGSLDEDGDSDKARSLVERCAACRDLHRDLEGIGAALRIDARGVVMAPRDFRLSEADAQRLGGRISPRGFLARLRRSMDSFARPLGASMATLGIVGLLVGSASFGLGGATSLQSTELTPTAGGPAAGNAPSAPAGATDRAALGPEETVYVQIEVDRPGDAREATEPGPMALLFGGSLVLLVGGLGLILLEARRRRGPGTSQNH